MVQRADERLDGVAALVGDLAAHRQHLLDPAAPDLRGRQSDPADAAFDRDRIPWFADANSVDLAGGERVGGEGRAGHDDLDILVGPDSDRSEEHTSELQSLMSISYAVF